MQRNHRKLLKHVGVSNFSKQNIESVEVEVAKPVSFRDLNDQERLKKLSAYESVLTL